MKETGMSHGLEVNAEVDERYHVEKSTQAACQYLKNGYAKYGNWALAAASYNLGQGGVDKQLGRQKRDNYFDLLLNEETARYVFRILAMKEIVRDPERYGFHLRKKDLYAPYRTRTTHDRRTGGRPRRLGHRQQYRLQDPETAEPLVARQPAYQPREPHLHRAAPCRRLRPGAPPE